MTYKINSPLRVPAGKKDFILNLGNYRNTHYRALNDAKINYAAMIKAQVSQLPLFDTPIELLFTLYPADKRLCDLDNVLSIHAKFFQDALVSNKKIGDDNYRYIYKTSNTIGLIDKENPRVEIEIRTTKEIN